MPLCSTAAPTIGGFGTAPASTAPAFGGFGSVTTAAAPAFGGFGTTATTIATPAFNLGGLGTNTSSTATAPTFNFNPTAPTNKTATFGSGFGTTPASTASLWILSSTSAPGFGGFGTTTSVGATQFSGFGLGGTPQPTSAPGVATTTTTQGNRFSRTLETGSGLKKIPKMCKVEFWIFFSVNLHISIKPPLAAGKPSVGLGGTPFPGFDGTGLGTGASSIPVTSTGQAQTAVDGSKGPNGGGGLKETNIPKELMQDIDNFKRFVKEEKSVSSDIAHVSPKAHQKLKTEIKTLNTIVKELASGVAKQKIQVEKLKKESALEMQNVEIAQVGPF